MVRGTLAPDFGDLIWLDFDPQAGHEQAGRRPALVLTPRIYNERAGLCLAAPITNQTKGYPFEVALPSGLRITGVVLVDHIKSLDWQARKAEIADQAPASALAEVQGKLRALLQL